MQGIVRKGKYLIVDTETTGFHPFRNGLIQLAAVSTDKELNILNTFKQDVCPPDGVEIVQESLDITGFTMERIRSGVSYEKVCEQFAIFIKENFESKPIAIGQFYPFDYAFLDYVFTVSGFNKNLDAQDVLGNDFIDTKSLVNTLNLKAELNNQPLIFKSTSLSKPGGLKEVLNISKNHQAHDALGDVMATREVLIKLLELMK